MYRKESERTLYLDACKGFLSFLVVFGHCVALYMEDDPVCRGLFWVIYSFHMPAFFFLSGYFSRRREKSVDELFQSIILPALPFELLYQALHLALGMENAYPFLTPVFCYWYLFALFAARSILKTAVQIRGILPLSVLAALLAGFNPYIGEYFALSRFLCVFPFFLLGYFLRDTQLSKIRTAKWYAVITGIILAAVLLILGYAIAEGNVDLFRMHTPYTKWTDLFVRGIQMLVAAIMILVLLRLAPEKRNLLTHFGTGGYLVYIFNFYFVEILAIALPHGAGDYWNWLGCLVFSGMSVWVMNQAMIRWMFSKITQLTCRLVQKTE